MNYEENSVTEVKCSPVPFVHNSWASHGGNEMASNTHFSIFSLLSNWQSLFLIVFLLFYFLFFIYIFYETISCFWGYSGILENIWMWFRNNLPSCHPCSLVKIAASLMLFGFLNAKYQGHSYKEFILFKISPILETSITWGNV